jgi:uncharacterized membrane protein
MKHPEALNALWNAIATGLEVAGVAVIVLGAIGTAVPFFWRSFKEGGFHTAFTQFRSDFGKAILLGLEFLVAADIVGTVAIGPTLQDLSVLGLLVLIRTFLSFALEVEITGRWPWQWGKPEAKGD